MKSMVMRGIIKGSWGGAISYPTAVSQSLYLCYTDDGLIAEACEYLS